MAFENYSWKTFDQTHTATASRGNKTTVENVSNWFSWRASGGGWLNYLADTRSYGMQTCTSALPVSICQIHTANHVVGRVVRSSGPGSDKFAGQIIYLAWLIAPLKSNNAGILKGKLQKRRWTKCLPDTIDQSADQRKHKWQKMNDSGTLALPFPNSCPLELEAKVRG